MRFRRSMLVAAILMIVGCSDSRPPAVSRTAEVDAGVRDFLATVARDVTAEGPVAWRRHFADGPSFFMASDGRLAFPDGASAMDGIQEVARTLKHIELRWGNDPRIDPMGPDLAAVGLPWHEVLVNAAGEKTEAEGFFTGVVEQRGGRWRFRNAHWSRPVPAGR